MLIRTAPAILARIIAVRNSILHQAALCAELEAENRRLKAEAALLRKAIADGNDRACRMGFGPVIEEPRDRP